MTSNLDIYRAALTICLAATGCADRSQLPTSYVDCTAIFAEMRDNNAELRELALVASSQIGQNDAAGVAGLGTGPIQFGLNSQETPEQQSIAINSRLRYLVFFAEIRHCSAPAP